MARYATRQRRALQEYLSRHPDESLSARQIAEGLCGDGISVSAVYRNLAQMELEGEVRRTGKAGSRAR